MQQPDRIGLAILDSGGPTPNQPTTPGELTASIHTYFNQGFLKLFYKRVTEIINSIINIHPLSIIPLNFCML